MICLYADKTQLILKNCEQITSGSANVYSVNFEFSADWDGLERTVIFRAGTDSRAVLLDDTRECKIPWEVLVKPDVKLFCGVYGTQGGYTVLPTIWSDLGWIRLGAALGENEQLFPTPELWEQELEKNRDHRNLYNRDAKEQHPIDAISGLTEELERIPEPVEPLTNTELEEILK